MRGKIQLSRMLGMALIFQGMVFDKNNAILDLSVTIFIELETMCINEDPVSHLKCPIVGLSFSIGTTLKNYKHIILL